ncbi:MJ0042-type zinc finger domain-containing protein [Bremerella sp. P1]|uniref:MJ0042-type zinc finger domain-containing protein n=1 Tax=Bremerella sp. P1 TaxID=3026424 RepID=UPI00236812F2|nr:zinc-ribbon domain-containing protein [Bremerella sp. P1]WDI41401.1 hypothetical protein PSR63_23315 [Bremerella sp. P1]
MAKLHIICPKCSTKYPVADQKLAGRRVTCKKCSEKFVAEIQGADPPPEDDFMLASPSDPLGDDLFGDFPTSVPASSGPALGTLPPKKKRSSSSSLPIVPLVLGGAGVLVLVVVVIFAISALSSMAPSGGGQGASSDDLAFAAHLAVMERQFESTRQFLAAIEGINGEGDIPKFITTLVGMTSELRSYAVEIRDIQPLPEYMHKRMEKKVKPMTDGLLPRMKAAGAKLANYRSPEVTTAALNYHSALGELVAVLNEANSRTPQQQAEIDRRLQAERNDQQAKEHEIQESTAANANSNEPPYEPSGQPMPDSERPPSDRTVDPFGPGFNPGMPDRSYRRDPAQDAINDMKKRYGEDKMVRLECKSISSEQFKKIREIIKPWMFAQAYAHWLDPEIRERVIVFPYDGDVNELAAKITFGEVDEVLVEQRRIRLKSITLP